MKYRTIHNAVSLSGVKPVAIKVFATAAVTLTLVGCRTLEDPGQVQSWTLVDSAQRHPIIVKKSPSRIKVGVRQGENGLSAHQRARISNFLGRFRASGTGDSKLVISAPSGSPNEVAAMHAVADIRDLVSDYGIADDIVRVEAFHDEDNPQPPIRLSYTRFVAKGPECGDWSTNLADNPRNLDYPNFGCAYQRNIAAMVANPADLLEPRSTTGRDATRRDVVYGKYYKGSSTVAKKTKAEKARVKGN